MSHVHLNPGDMASLATLATLLPGARCVGDPGISVQRVHTDSRTVAAGDLFVALRGERFDGHDHLSEARRGGAVAALATHGMAEAGLPGLLVDDTLVALQALATAWRGRHLIPLIAVTGSNGKTTVTQMIASILRAHAGEAALATAGNFNNHIGVPLTLLRLRSKHRCAVVELGMNHPGEIAELAAQAQPTVALVNNAQREHQEFMHTVEAVARENGQVILALPASGVAVFPADDPYTPLWRQLAGHRQTLTFALDAAADVCGTAQWRGDHWQLSLQARGQGVELALHVAGRHNLKNALAAAACALAAAVPLGAVVQGLSAFRPVSGRSQIKALLRDGAPLTLIDDTYNANPDSVQAAIDVLADLPGPRWLVLGDMGEVGDEGMAFHREAGERARAAGIEHFWCAGRLSAAAAAAYGEGARHFDDTMVLLQHLLPMPPFAAVLVKGSRFMKMERVVAALQAETAEGHHAA